MLGLLLSAALAVAPADAVANCATNPAREIIALPYDEFDTQSGPGAWRSLLDHGCVDAAVGTLQAYRRANGQRMTFTQTEELSFHIRQALAMSGREGESAVHFEHAVGPRSSVEWAAYVSANLGFVRKDRKQLERALAYYRHAPGSDPMRLRFIRGFLVPGQTLHGSCRLRHVISSRGLVGTFGW